MSRKLEMFDLPEEEIQDLLASAKSGSTKAQERLFVVFDNFLNKYVQLLFGSKFNLKSSPDIRNFIALYVGDPKIRFPLLKNKLDANGYRQVSEVISRLNYMVVRYCDESDVEQTVKMAFMHVIMIYKRKESNNKSGGFVPFAGYLNQYFKYIIKRFVDMFLIDQNGIHTFPLLSDDVDYDSEDGDGAAAVGFAPPPGPSLEDIVGPEMIDEMWVAGDTAFSPFDALSVQDRQLLRWRYADGLKASEIAYRITEHPNTLRDHFNRIRGKIMEEIESD